MYINDEFENVIWTDEATVQLETHRKKCYRKLGKPSENKPCAKHPVKVHVWTGISMRGATSILLFTGIRNAEFYVSVLEKGLLPFLHQKFPDGQHRFMEDNDPKHVHAMLKHLLKSID